VRPTANSRAIFLTFVTKKWPGLRSILLFGGFLFVTVLLSASSTFAQCGSCGCPAGQDCYCGLEYELGYCYCVPGTPIVIDLDGNGFHLTNPAQGVPFDFFMSGPVQISWTAAGAGEGWLVLPPKDGLIENGTEMFGNLTPQPKSEDPNGFAALAVYDDPKNGGNGDGIIDWHDAIFSRLRIWRDFNHNGVSEPSELISLPDAGIVSISLFYTETGYVDKWGNRFRYRARITSTTGADKWAYDVILQFTKITTTVSKRRADHTGSTAASASAPPALSMSQLVRSWFSRGWQTVEPADKVQTTSWLSSDSVAVKYLAVSLLVRTLLWSTI